jgi:HPt (histidine-containing phosphotransfer) domain-containing protein
MDTNAHDGKGEAVRREAGAAADPLDLAHLRRFTLGDRSLEMEVLHLFIDQAPFTIEAMKEAGTDREWASAAHTLKGSARAVGAWRLATLAEQAERLGGRSDHADCNRLLREIDEATREASAYIASLGRAA